MSVPGSITCCSSFTYAVYQVPPIIIQVLRFKDICAKYDLSSVKFVYCGAAPLGEETIRDMKSLYPDWTIAQAYGQSDHHEVEGINAKINRYDGNSHSSMLFK